MKSGIGGICALQAIEQDDCNDTPGPGPDPGGWVPIQQMVGWGPIEYTVPLNPETEDTGQEWVGVDHAITGLDNTLYIVNASIALQDAINLPARIRVTQWEDSVVTPGTIIQPALIRIQDGSGNTYAEHFNPEPPTNEFSGSPFTFQLDVPRQGSTPATSSFSINFNPPNILNDGEEGEISLIFTLDVDIGDGWIAMQDVPGVIVDPFGGTYETGQFSVSGVTDTTTSVWNISINSDLDEIPVRINIVEYAEVLGDPPGTKTSAASIDTGVGGDVFESSMDYPQSWPTNGFAGSPYVGTAPASVSPANPGDPPSLVITMMGAAYNNAEVSGVVMNYSISIEVQP
jgi:hypothetical protein